MGCLIERKALFRSCSSFFLNPSPTCTFSKCSNPLLTKKIARKRGHVLGDAKHKLVGWMEDHGDDNRMAGHTFCTSLQPFLHPPGCGCSNSMPPVYPLFSR